MQEYLVLLQFYFISHLYIILCAIIVSALLELFKKNLFRYFGIIMIFSASLSVISLAKRLYSPVFFE